MKKMLSVVMAIVAMMSVTLVVADEITTVERIDSLSQKFGSTGPFGGPGRFVSPVLAWDRTEATLAAKFPVRGTKLDPSWYPFNQPDFLDSANDIAGYKVDILTPGAENARRWIRGSMFVTLGYALPAAYMGEDNPVKWSGKDFVLAEAFSVLLSITIDQMIVRPLLHKEIGVLIDL